MGGVYKAEMVMRLESGKKVELEKFMKDREDFGSAWDEYVIVAILFFNLSIFMNFFDFKIFRSLLVFRFSTSVARNFHKIPRTT